VEGRGEGRRGGGGNYLARGRVIIWGRAGDFLGKRRTARKQPGGEGGVDGT